MIITAKCTSPYDPLPLSITNKIINTVPPLYHKIINMSLTTGGIQSELTHATITPILKNASLDYFYLIIDIYLNYDYSQRF